MDKVNTTCVLETQMVIVSVPGEISVFPVQSDMMILPILNGEYGVIISSESNTQLGNKL
jgi:hypothetical protein